MAKIKAQVSLWKGLKENFDLKKHSEGLYLTTDTKEVFVNGVAVSAIPDFTKSQKISLKNSFGELVYYGTTPIGIITSPATETKEARIISLMNFVNGVSEISTSTFYDCDNVKKIEIPDGTEIIGDYAFYDCDILKKIYFPDSVTSIGDYAFYGCVVLQDVNIPKNCKKIGEYAFYNCKKIGEILKINDAIEEIGNNAFEKCISIKTLYIGENIQKIGKDAFKGCHELANVVWNKTVYIDKQLLVEALGDILEDPKAFDDTDLLDEQDLIGHEPEDDGSDF